jgi:preprotein translocase subunit SecF
VLSRTIITSLTVFFSALALFLFGGEVIHDFALAMLLGVIVGTYSSVFVASPVVILLGRNKNPLTQKKR